MSTRVDRVYFELTTMCNLRCTHCFNYNNNFKNKYLSLEEFNSFYDKVCNKTNGIVLTGGEPFLHPDIEKFLDRLESENVVITTNATLRNKEYYANLLKKYPNLFLQISFDGMTKEVFERVRGKGTYVKVKKVVDYLCEIGLKDRIGLSTTILNYNIHEITNIVMYAKEKGIHSIHFPTLILEGRCAEDCTILPDVKQLNKLEDELLQLSIENEALNISVNTLNVVASFILDKDNITCVNNATIKVTVDGEIMPCPVAWKKEESLGHISQIEQYEDIIQKLQCVKLHIVDSESCSGCEVRDFCKMNYCEHCGIRNRVDKIGMSYRCSNLMYHIKNIMEEMKYDEKYVDDLFSK